MTGDGAGAPKVGGPMTKSAVYVVMVADRHTDPTPFVFSDRDNALAAARSYLESHVDEAYAGDDEIGEQPTPDGWLFYGTWSHEGDSIWVVERVPDEPIEL